MALPFPLTPEITIQVDAEVARAFKSSSAQDRRKLEALLSIYPYFFPLTHYGNRSIFS